MDNKMSILGVDLSENLISALRRHPSQPEITCSGFRNAFDLLDESHYTNILFDLTESPQPYQDVLDLLSITPVTTQLISISPRRISHTEYKFSKLGVRNLIAPVTAEQLCKYCR